MMKRAPVIVQIPLVDWFDLCSPDENDGVHCGKSPAVKRFSILRGGGFTWMNMFYVTRISFQKALLVPVLLFLEQLDFHPSLWSLVFPDGMNTPVHKTEYSSQSHLQSSLVLTSSYFCMKGQKYCKVNHYKILHITLCASTLGCSSLQVTTNFIFSYQILYIVLVVQRSLGNIIQILNLELLIVLLLWLAFMVFMFYLVVL